MKTVIYLMMALTSCSVNALANDKIDLDDLMGKYRAGNTEQVLKLGFKLPTQQQQQQPNGPFEGCLEDYFWTKIIYKREVTLQNDSLVSPESSFPLNSEMSKTLRSSINQLFENKHVFLTCTASHSKPRYSFYDNRGQWQAQDTSIDSACMQQCSLNGGEQFECRQACTVTQINTPTDNLDGEKIACEAKNLGLGYRDYLEQCSLKVE